MVLAGAAVACVAVAEEAATNAVPAAAAAPPATAAAAKPATPKPLSPQDQAQYTRLTQGELQLKTRIALLNELVDEHFRRADEARIGLPEKAQWETDLAQELRERSIRLLGQLNALTKQRLAFQAAHAPPAPPSPDALEDNKALNADQLAYLMTLDERLVKVRQELLALDAAAKDFQLELATNNTPEEMGRISDLLNENARESRQWEREESELLLKKLEFRALRR